MPTVPIHAGNRIGQSRCLSHPTRTVNEEFGTGFSKCPHQAPYFYTAIREMISLDHAMNTEGIPKVAQVAIQM